MGLIYKKLLFLIMDESHDIHDFFLPKNVNKLKKYLIK